MMMEKTIIKALFGTIVLISVMLFTGCTSDDIADGSGNKGNNSNGPEVNVDFVFNVATGNTATSRMSSANTQATDAETFRGIENAALMAFKLTNDGKNVAAATTADKYYDMGNIMGSGAIDPDGTGSTPKSRRVVELSLPTGTNTLMFWGKAIKDGTSNQQGSVDWHMSENLSNISFTLSRRIPTGDGPNGETAFKQYEKLVAGVMTQLLERKETCQGTYKTTGFDTQRAWKDYVTISGTNLVRRTDLSPLGEIIADAFITLNTFQANEVRAGSGPSVAMMLSDLYNVINSVANADPTSQGEAITKAFAGQMRSKLNQLVDPSSKKWVTTMNTIKALSGIDDSDIALVTQDLNNFPRQIFNVPQGATTLKLTITNPDDDATRTFKYDYNETIPTYAMDGGTGGSFDPLNYRYPAELCYFGNSPVRVTDDTHETSQYPDGTANWDTETSWEAGATGTGSKAWTKNGHVLSSTRSVAMQENINYGTALLKSTVRYGTDVLQDNNHAIQQRNSGANEPNNTITVGAGTFTLTGLLIGGVEPEVGWNYLAKEATPQYKSFVYDPELPSTAIPTYSAGEGNKSVPNYTLLWDNWNPADLGQKQNVVYIALEFVNNSGKDFWGLNNLIRNGATFYIAGKLDPDAGLSTTDRSEGITWPLARTAPKEAGKFHYALPPYDGDGNTIKERRVFIQDYMTTADFVIGATSLQKALVEVPDLRSSQISLGLSVDLQWQTGLNFGNIILGD